LLLDALQQRADTFLQQSRCVESISSICHAGREPDAVMFFLQMTGFFSRAFAL